MIARLLFVLVLAATPALAQNSPGRWWEGFANEGFATAFSAPVTNATVSDGVLYACGDFRGNGSTPMMTLAKWEGGAWVEVADEPPFQTPSVVMVYDGEIISNGVSSSWVPCGPWKWNGTNWEVLGEGLDRGYLGRVEAWAIYKDELVVAGDFSEDSDPVPTAGIARWDGTSWSGVGGGLRSGAIYALEVFDGDLYAGGTFEVMDDTTIVDLARWDGSQWSAVSALDPTTDNPESGPGLIDTAEGYFALYDFAVHDGKLVIAGLFDTIGAMAVPGLVLYDPSGVEPVWEVPVAEPGAGKISEVVSYGGSIYGGRFSGNFPAQTGPYSLEYVAGGAWHEVADGPDGQVTALVEFEGLLQVGGYFDRAGGMACDSWVQFDGSTFSPRQNPGAQGLSGSVVSLHPWQGDLLAVGDFASAGPVEAGGVAVWDGSSWTGIGAIPAGSRVADGWVDGTDLYVVGDFKEIDGTPTPGIARYDGSQWHAWPTPTGLEDVSFYQVATWNGRVYAGVDARQIATGTLEIGLIEIDGADWQFVYPDFTVHALEVFDGKLMIGGSPRAAPYVGLLSYDGSSFTPVEDPAYPDALSSDAARGLRVIDGLLYVGVEALGAHIVTWDGTNLAPFGPSSGEPLPPHSGIGIRDARDVCLIGSDAFLVGRGDYNGFTVWRWDGVDTHWRIVDRGTDGIVNSALEFQGELYIGGDFALTGMSRSLHRIGGEPIVSSGIARFLTASIVSAPTPARTSLHQNRPNPFNPRTEIRFEIPDGGRDVSLVVYDARGRVVKRLISGFRPAGPDRVVWDGTDDRGTPVASGSYMYLLRAGEVTQARKMSLIR